MNVVRDLICDAALARHGTRVARACVEELFIAAHGDASVAVDAAPKARAVRPWRHKRRKRRCAVAVLRRTAAGKVQRFTRRDLIEQAFATNT